MPIQSMLCPKCGKPASEYDRNKWQCLNCQAKFIYEAPPEIPKPDLYVRQDVALDEGQYVYVCPICKRRASRFAEPEQECPKCHKRICPKCLEPKAKKCVTCHHKDMALGCGCLLAIVLTMVGACIANLSK